MTVNYLDNKPFLKRVVSAFENLDTLDFETIDSALSRLTKNMAHNLNEIVDVYAAHKFDISASVIDLTDKILEKKNKDFLDDLVSYVNEMDLEFKNRAVEYGKLCLKCIQVKKKNKAELIAVFSEVLENEKTFQTAITQVREFSRQKRNEAKIRKVTYLSKYKDTFTNLDNLADLTWAKVKERLIKNEAML